jgi:Bacteriophage head to tail connecting protein
VTVQDDIRRAGSLRADWEAWHREDMSQLEQYLMPGRGSLRLRAGGDLAHQAEPAWERVTSSVGIHAADMLAAAMAGGLTAPGSEWFSLTVRDPNIAAEYDVASWLEDVTLRMQMALQEGGVYQVLGECYHDLVVFGTAAMFLAERPLGARGTWAGLAAEAWPVGDFVFDEGAHRIPDTIYYAMRVSPRAVVAQFGAGKAGPDITREANDRPGSWLTILRVIAPEGDGWRERYVDPRRQRVIDSSFYEELPFMVARWAKRSGDRWGRGPGHNAIADVRQLCETLRIWNRAAPLAMQPPTVELEDAIIGDPDQRPGGRNVEKVPNAIRPLVTGARVEIKTDLVTALTAAIRDTFFLPQLLFHDRTNRTATEATLEWQQAQRIFGPVLGRLKSELLNPLLRRVLGLMLRGGALPQVPEMLRQFNPDIDIQYESPLERAQRTADLVAIEQFIGSTLGMAQAWPEVLDLVDADQVQRQRARLAGVPSDALRPPREVAGLRAQRQAAQQRQAMLQQGQQIAEMAGAAAPALETLQAMGGQNGNGAGPEAP